jgi:hypothetical protein
MQILLSSATIYPAVGADHRGLRGFFRCYFLKDWIAH